MSSEHRSTEAAQHERLRAFQAAIEVIPAAVIVFDADGVLTMTEGAGLAMMGATPGEDVGQSLFEQHADRPEVLAAARRTLAGEAHTGDITIADRTLSVGWHPIVEDGSVVGGFAFSLDVTTERAALATLQQRTEQTTALADLSHRVAEAGGDLGTVLAAVTETAVQLLAPAALLFFHDPEGAWVETVAHHHRDPELRDLQDRVVKDLRRPMTEPVRELVRTGAPLFITDVPTAAFRAVTPPELCDRIQQVAPRSYLLVPLRTRGGIIGHMALGLDGEPLPDHEVAFAVELADRAALLIDNTRMLTALRTELEERARIELQLRRRADREACAAALGRQVLAGGSLLDIAHDAAAMVVDGLRIDACKVVERLSTGELITLAAVGLDLAPLTRLGEESLAARTIRDGNAVVVPDFWASTDPQPAETAASDAIRSAASVPLRLGQERLGCVAALGTDARAFDADDLVFLENVGNIISGAIQQERVRQAEQRAAQVERLAAVGQVAAGMAHDFNNIMLAVRLYSEMVADQTGLDEAGREHLRALSTHVEHASRMVAQVLSYARDIDLEVHEVDVADLVTQTLRDAEATLPAGIQVTQERVGSPVAPVDAMRLRQVLHNLLSNAADAMPDGGEILVRVAFSELGLGDAVPSSLAADGWVGISVQDTGAGMDEETCARARDPFFTTKAPASGTGLGLPQVERIAAQHGGSLEIVSAPGAGTTVTVWLPAASAAAAQGLGTRS